MAVFQIRKSKLLGLLFLLMLIQPLRVTPQALYFPSDTMTWDTIAYPQLGWCPDSLASLHNFLDTTDSRAFIILSGGRIAVEWYFNGFNENSICYRAYHNAAHSLSRDELESNTGMKHNIFYSTPVGNRIEVTGSNTMSLVFDNFLNNG